MARERLGRQVVLAHVLGIATISPMTGDRGSGRVLGIKQNLRTLSIISRTAGMLVFKRREKTTDEVS